MFQFIMSKQLVCIFIMLDSEGYFWKIDFWINKFTTSQILKWKFDKVSDFELKFLQRFKFRTTFFTTCQIFMFFFAFLMDKISLKFTTQTFRIVFFSKNRKHLQPTKSSCKRNKPSLFQPKPLYRRSPGFLLLFLLCGPTFYSVWNLNGQKLADTKNDTKTRVVLIAHLSCYSNKVLQADFSPSSKRTTSEQTGSFSGKLRHWSYCRRNLLAFVVMQHNGLFRWPSF